MSKKYCETRGEYTVTRQSHSNGVSIRVYIADMLLERDFFNDWGLADEWADSVIAQFEAERKLIRSVMA